MHRSSEQPRETILVQAGASTRGSGPKAAKHALRGGFAPPLGVWQASAGAAAHKSWDMGSGSRPSGRPALRLQLLSLRSP